MERARAEMGHAAADSPSGDTFVTAETHKGLLPQILDELLTARKRAKRDMKAATDPMEKAVQNGRQLALKVYSPSPSPKPSTTSV